MKTELYLTDFVSDSQYSTDIIVGARGLLIGIKQMLGNIALNIVLAMVFVPSALLLRYMCNRLAAKMPVSLDIEDAQDYVLIRSSYDKLSLYLSLLRQIQALDRTNIPFMLHFAVKEMDKMIGIIARFSLILKQTIADLEQTNSKNSLFQQIPEADIWNARVPAYDYRL